MTTITVYGAPNCPACITLKADLDKRMDVWDGTLERITGYSPKRVKEVFG